MTSRVDYILINSSDRDISKYPKVNNYTIPLSYTIKNITQIELISSSIPNKNTPFFLPYLLLKCDGIENIKTGTRNAFSCLYLKPTTSDHIQVETGSLFPKIFDTPLSSLSRINIAIANPDGTLFNFTEPNGDLTNAFQNSFLFKVTFTRN